MTSGSDKMDYIQYVGAIVEGTLPHMKSMDELNRAFLIMPERWKKEIAIKSKFSERRKQIENAAAN
jgi:hypothetical protein